MQAYFQQFSAGDRVYLHVSPSVHGGMYFPKFLGRAGIIKGKKGRCYEVSINDMGKEKTLVVHPVHLKRS